MNSERRLADFSEAPAVVASGNFVLVGGVVDADFGKGQGWKRSAATFVPPGPAAETVMKYFQFGGSDSDENRGGTGPQRAATPKERASSYSPETAMRLFGGTVSEEGPPNGVYIDRWHLPFERPEVWFKNFTTKMIECLVLRGFSEDSETRFCLLVVHLVTPSVGNSEAARKLANVLFDEVRVASSRKMVLENLRILAGECFDFAPLAGDRESSAVCYPVFSALDLRSVCDEDVLAVRELSTITPSAEHGSSGTSEARVARARDDLIRMSDSWNASITSRGAVFMSRDADRFIAAPLYVSSIYADVLAVTFLARSAFVELNRRAHEAVGLSKRMEDYERDLESLLQLRVDMFRVSDAIVDLDVTESRNIGLVANSLRRNIRLDSVRDEAIDTSADLLQMVSLRRDLVGAAESREQGRRQQWTNIILATLALVSLPLSALYGVLGLLSSAPEMSTWTIGGSVFIVAIGGAVIAGMIAVRGKGGAGNRGSCLDDS